MPRKNPLVILSNQYKAAKHSRQMEKYAAASTTKPPCLPVQPVQPLPNFCIEDIFDDLVKRFGQPFAERFARDLLEGNSMAHYDVPAIIDRYFEWPWQPMLSELADIRASLRDESE